MRRLNWPDQTGRAALAGAVAIGGGAWLAQTGPAWVGLIAALALILGGRATLAVLVVCGLAVGLAADRRNQEPSPLGRSSASVTAVAVSDPAPAAGGWVFVARPVDGSPRIAVTAPDPMGLMAGDTMYVAGSMSSRPGRLHRNDVAAWLTARDVRVLDRATGWMALANFVRARVHGLFDGDDAPAALMRGFLIGDTTAMSPLAVDEMKRAGLVHFVAVSGGNVALFVGAVWLGLGVLPLGPRQRAAVGLSAVVLFVLVTRWEPSVVRAGLMIGLVLTGRLFGVPIGGWTALGVAAGTALLVSPELLFDVGFQLSLLATCGLMLGSGIWDHRRPQLVWRALAATFSAQLAVSPLLIASFGSVPAFSALTNVLAAPLVTAATAVGWGAAFLNLSIAADAAGVLAALVLDLARMASALPQVGTLGVSLMVTAAGCLSWRPGLGILAAATALIVAMVPAPAVSGPVVVFLDVGQGDAALVRTASGALVAVDTGPDPIAYSAALRRHRVSHIDLLVLTHSDADHVGGLDALPGRVTVARVWRPDFTSDETWTELLSGIDAEPRAVGAGVEVEIHDLRLSVLGPGRRFAADNDGSIVLWLDVEGTTTFLGGDVESVAQRELPPLRPDVMLIPHHGSATTDVEWLRDTVGRVAVLSFGSGNTFGHPAGEVVDTLNQSGASIFSTAGGDVVIPLGRQLESSAAVAQRRPKVHGVSRLA